MVDNVTFRDVVDMVSFNLMARIWTYSGFASDKFRTWQTLGWAFANPGEMC